MEALFLRVVWISLTCSVVLVPLLVGKGWLRHHVRAKALYVVWLILALRLVVPVDLSLPEPAVTVEAPSYQVALPARTPSANLPAGAQIEEPSAVVGQSEPFPSPLCCPPCGSLACWRRPWCREAGICWPAGGCCETPGLTWRRRRRQGRRQPAWA